MECKIKTCDDISKRKLKKLWLKRGRGVGGGMPV